MVPAEAAPARAPLLFRKELQASGLPVGMTAEAAAAAVFCALEQRLPAGLAIRFRARLPEELRPFAGRCAPHDAREGFGQREFLRRVAEHLAEGLEEAEEATRAVFAGARKLASPEEERELVRLLPYLTALWDGEREVVPDAGAALEGAPSR